VDIDEQKIQRLRNGEVPISEPGLEDIVSRNAAAGRLSFTTALADAVQTSVVVFHCRRDTARGGWERQPFARGSHGSRHWPGYERLQGIVDKSTVPVGTGRKVTGWIKEELDRRSAQHEFDVVSNPEFLREGSAVQDFTHPDRE
jgi:UDPglucose 6-dehydrogenase